MTHQSLRRSWKVLETVLSHLKLKQLLSDIYVDFANPKSGAPDCNN